jgi:hypothetical protein
MKCEGGCYCGALRYVAEGDPMLQAQCHCRECQYFSGGGANLFMIMPGSGFSYTKGTPKQFTRSDLDNPVTRDFCADCGTHVLTRRDDTNRMIIKIGTLDDPTQFQGPQMAIFTIDQQPFHHIAEGLPAFERLPQR